MEQTHSEHAEHVHTLTLTISGASDEAAARDVFAKLLGTAEGGLAESTVVRAGAADNTFEASFPICCFNQGGDYSYGFCRYGVPGICGPEYPGCPA